MKFVIFEKDLFLSAHETAGETWALTVVAPDPGANGADPYAHDH